MNTMTTPVARAGGSLTNADLQARIDRAAASHEKEVRLPAGLYLMHDSLKLRSGLRIIGEGAPGSVVLQKVPSVRSAINDFLGYGHFEFRVIDPDRFRVGMGVHLLDDNAGGFYTTVATIIDRDGELFFIDRPFNHDYLPSRNGMVISAYPIVEGCNAQDASIENVTIDGNYPEETFCLNGCRGAGVFLIGCHRVAVRHVEVHRYHGDGISFQQCTDITVENCRVHHNTGGGLHPGSGSVRYVLQDNRIHDNGRDGLFYCLRTTHGICQRNEFVNNAHVGVSVGERDTDHLIRDNLVKGNKAGGIEFRKPNRRSGDRTRVVGNRVEHNGGDAQIVVHGGLEDIHIEGNAIAASGPAVLVGDGCRRISVVGNTVSGRPQQPTDVRGKASFERPATLPPVGPEAAPPGSVRHLHLPNLRPWRAQ